ncbi:hypothetical protein C6P08_06235 [Weissella confusa]|uniref:DUF3472 domain-containing protein n=1 Tax=Weissella confusa TaxID=1583 RepID=UPI001091DFC2|nr:DUF3472 domain-containing protein [Weissella confusa]MBJ7694401.1 DUF3472 domain-containing protein [Weissella confusa]QBZ04799.1 hypothetical protein C6P08_06235 [Weissella confusa]
MLKKWIYLSSSVLALTTLGVNGITLQQLSVHADTKTTDNKASQGKTFHYLDKTSLDAKVSPYVQFQLKNGGQYVLDKQAATDHNVDAELIKSTQDKLDAINQENTANRAQSDGHTDGYYHNAPNVYITPQNVPSNRTMVSSEFRATKSTPNTYWATQTINSGMEGGAYGGFQQITGNDESGQQIALFSIWNPYASKDPIKVAYASPDTKTNSFGAEGTGVQARTNYHFKIGSWYNQTIKVWQENGHTYYGQWLFDVDNQKWLLTGVYDYPVPNVQIQSDTAFMEDWNGDGQYARDGEIRNWVSQDAKTGTVTPATSLHVTDNDSDYLNWDGGTTSDGVKFHAGGYQQDSTIGRGKTFTVPSQVPSELSAAQITKYDLTKDTSTGNWNMAWAVDQSKAPQLNAVVNTYEVASNGSRTLVNTSPTIDAWVNESRFALDASKTYQVELTIHDIAGHTTTQTLQVDPGAPTGHAVQVSDNGTTNTPWWMNIWNWITGIGHSLFGWIGL